MPLLEQHAGGPKLYRDDLGRRGCSVCLRIGTSQDAIGHVERLAIGMHIHEHRRSQAGEKPSNDNGLGSGHRWGTTNKRISAKGRVFVRQSTNYWRGRAKAITLQYY